MDRREFKELAISKNKSESYIEGWLNYSDRLVKNGMPVIFDLKHICLLTGMNRKYILSIIYQEELFYTKHALIKKSGGERILSIPCFELKYLQRWILDNVVSKMAISDNATGFVEEKSIVDNAKMHLNQKCILNIDLKDFFTTIKCKRIAEIFNFYGYSDEVSFYLAKICTYNGCLPQGSPCSPALSNVICLGLDKRLNGIAESCEVKYSRYADDITFSGTDNVKDILNIATKIIENEGFQLNNEKTRVQPTHQRQEVTGIVINNGRLRVRKKYKRELNQEIYYCKKFGVQDHLKKINNDKMFYKEHLYGKAFYVKMVEPEEGIR